MADICDLNRWAQVVTPEFRYDAGTLYAESVERLADSPVIQRHLRYHERRKRQLMLRLERER